MRNFAKLFAAVLLVAVVVSVMVVLPTVTASAEGTMSPTILFNAEGGAGSWKTSATYLTKEEITSANEVTYWKYYFTESGLNSAGTAYNDSPYVDITPKTHNLADRSLSDGAGTEDTTDFLVIDLDIGTDSNPFSKIRFQTQFYTYKATGSRGTSKQYAHQQIYANDPENVYFDTTKSSTKIHVDEDLSSEWAHVTLLFDTRNDSTNGYLYYNGEFIRKYQAMTSGYEYLSAFRILVSQGASDSIDIQNETVSFANVTIKSFPIGYDGELATNFANIGNAEYSLADFSDLAYTLENLPVTNIAEITRNNEIIPVTSFAELEAEVQPGDAVKLLRDVTRPIAFPENVAVNVNGFNADKIVLDADWLIRTGSGKFLGAGAQEYSVAEDDETKTLVTDTLSNYIQSKLSGGANEKSLPNDALMSIKLLDDVYLKNEKSCIIGAKALEFDLNGHTAKIFGSAAHFFAFDGSYAATHLIIKNGNIDCTGTSGRNFIYLVNNVKVDVIDCHIISGSAPLLDQRNGTITFKGGSIESNISGSNEYCLSIKSYNGTKSTANFEGCTFTAKTSKTLLGITSVSSGRANEGNGRYGGMQNNVNFNGCTITSAYGSIMDVVTYANEHGSGTGVSLNNQNYANVAFDDCIITAKSAVVITSLPTLYSEYTKTADGIVKENIFANGLASDNNISFTGCTISTAYLLTQTEAGYTDAVKAFGEEVVAGNYTYTTDVVLADSFIQCSASIVSNAGVDAVGVSFTGKTRLSCDDFNKNDTQVKTVVTYADGMQLAYSSDTTYPYVVTDTYITYSYQLGVQNPVPFPWNDAEGDEVDISRVVTLANTDLYKYSWVRNGNAFTTKLEKNFAFSAKSNLTLYDYIYFNLFINKEHYDNAIALGATVSGVVIDENTEVVEIDNVKYYKIQAQDENITAPSDELISVTLSFNGAYGETYGVTNKFGVLKYAGNMLAKESTTGASRDIIEAVVNYIAAAQDYAGKDSTAAKALIEGAEFAALEAADVEGSAPVEVAVSYGEYISWLIKATEDATITVSYTVDGKATSFTKSVKAGDELEVIVKACDFANGITVTAGDNSATVTLASYYGLLTEAKDQAMVAAIYNYATAAQAYVNPYKPAN